MKNIVKKIFYHIYILLHQRKYKMSNGKKIKFLFIKKSSNELIVSFSGFPGKGKKAKYNYFRTLKNIKKNQLYILDDFGYESAGSYYLGEKGEYFLENEIPKLIRLITEKNNINITYFIGTSKGGWASLYYGIKLNSNYILSGAPQYYIGEYLKKNEYHLKILNGIIGNESEKVRIEQLNKKLKNTIENTDISDIKFIIHYSKNEPTYEEGIKEMLLDFKKKKANLVENIEYYSDHAEVGKYFKKLLSDFFKEEKKIEQ